MAGTDPLHFDPAKEVMSREKQPLAVASCIVAASAHPSVSPRQSFRLSGCKLNSGPEYALHAYIEATNGRKGTVNRSMVDLDVLQIVPNLFVFRYFFM